MEKKINVALFIDDFFPIIDGVVKVCDNYAREFINLNDNVTVYTPASFEKNYQDSEEYEVVRTPSFRFAKLEYPLAKPNKKRIKEKLINSKPDVIHAHSPALMGRFGIKMAKKLNIPLIGTFHSKFYDDILTATHSKTLAKIGVKYCIHFFNKCDAVWTVSNSTAQTLREYGYKGEITVMPNGTNFVKPDNEEALISKAKAKYGIKPNDKVLLFVGHLIWQKNIKLVIDSFSQLLKKDKNYKLFFVGEGGHEDGIKKYVDSLKITNNRIRFLGKISDQDTLKSIYGMSDLFFFPSTYDTFGIVVVEAAVMKKPALLVRGSNASERIIDGENGFLADNNVDSMVKRIEEIFSNPEKLREVGINASKTLPIPWSTLIKDIKKEYFNVIEKYKEAHYEKK